MIKKNAARIIKLFGYFFTAIALIFVGKSIWEQKKFLLQVDIRTATIILFAGIGTYTVANLILTIAWKMLLNWFGETRLNFLTCAQIYGKSQILKYIPGNLFYLPGRHALGIRYGAEHAPLAGAMTLEIAGLFAASSGISILGILFTTEASARLPLFAVVTTLALSFAFPAVLKRALSFEFVQNKIPVLKKMRWGGYFQLLAIWSLYLAFFVLIGLIMLWTIAAVTGRWNAAPFNAVLSAFAISWLLGSIAPGAPAGAGIRESVIILLLSKYIGESNSVLVSLMMRIVTILGDVVFYFISARLGNRN